MNRGHLMLKKISVGLTVVFLLTSCSLKSSVIVIENVTIIDGIGESAQSEMTIIIEDNRLRTIGKSSRVSYPKSAHLIDGRNKYVIPGLWDMHVHLYNTERTIPLYIIAGVTGVRDMGSELDKTLSLRQKIRSGTLAGPRIKTAGSMIESTAWMNQYVELMRQMNASESAILSFLKNRSSAGNVEESLRLVDSLADQGVDFIKIRHAPSKEAFFGIAREAKKKNLKLAGHFLWIVSMEEASDAGQASLEHNIFPGFNSRPPEEKKRIFDTMIKNNTHFVPTLVAGEKEKIPEDELSRIIEDVSGSVDPRNRFVEKKIRDDWRETFELNKRDKERPSTAVIRGMLEDSNVFLQQAFEAGVPFMAGTDAPVTSVYAGFSLHDELQLLVRILRMTPLDAIKSATAVPAKFLGLDKDLGTIEEGKLADLLILRKNPLADISNIQEIEMVILDGRIFDSSARERMLSEAAKAVKSDYFD